MKKLTIAIFVLTLACSPAHARQYNTPVYSKNREVNGRDCQQFYAYRDGAERFVGVSCN